MDPTKTLESRGSRESTEVQPSSTIAPYYTSLNGVNQPMNLLFRDVLWWTLGIAGLAILTIRMMEIMWAKLRQVSAMSDPRAKQAYWRTSQFSWMPGVKKHITYAPLWNKRHNREFKLSSAVNVGTLPSRLHMMMIIAYVGSNIAYMFVLNWSNENKYSLCAEMRGRSGTLALVNMVPLIIFAGRNNPLISMLKISFDTYNLLHRWMGRIVVAESIIHTVAWAIPAVADRGWDITIKKLIHSPFKLSGFIGTSALVLLLILSVSPFRHAFYETFLNLHILLALVIFVCTWVHCATATLPGGLPQLSWIMSIVALWFADRFARLFRLVYNNWSRKGFTDAICEALPGEVTRVTIRLPRYLTIPPGTHAYLRFSGIRFWESHPFSIAWVEHMADHSLPFVEKEEPIHFGLDKKNTITSVSFLIGAQTGFTRQLFKKAQASPGGICIRAAMEGPYAGHHNLDSYGHAVLFAGSTGITHQLSYLNHFLEGYKAGTVATRKLTLVWIVREYESLEWVRPYMDRLPQVPDGNEILNIEVYVTRPRSPRSLAGLRGNNYRLSPGRPNIPLVVSREVQRQVGAMVVTVCGPGALADDVRGAVRAVQGDNVVDFIEESFTW
ncbi:ferric reductase [Metarhizium rileyi]|uniref:Ferric reductase n=1 Tax=Metarhizium rileyi (strain RCEF 4871) TaxID=1649241 RepID=A0A167GU03_METRR|nr:ferric reductase [Metarhizium rileyi RCEF 4871]